jgi:8-hydroxy-5-deazaflavin:NADPH oxidoreductase
LKIGVIGAGRMAGALGTCFVEAGHTVMIGARKPEAATETVPGARRR